MCTLCSEERRIDLHLLYVIDSLVPAGAERSLSDMAPHLVGAGVTLDVAFLQDRPGLHRELEASGATLHPIAGSGGRLGWIGRARRLIGNLRPDLVHTTLFEADIAGRVAGRLAGVPVVSSLVNVAYGPEQLQDRRLVPWRVRAARFLDAATARGVRRFHALTQHVAAVMGRRLRIPADRIDVIPRGRDPGTLGTRNDERRDRVRGALGVGPHEPIVLAAGRHEYQKGLDVLLQAVPAILQAVPGTRLLVAGREGNKTPMLRAMAERSGLGPAVRFLGVRSDVPDLMCAADAFVFPSRWEGLGGVVIEAMALEAPIVASDLPAIREIVGHEGARLVPSGDPNALAAALIEALTDRREASARARTARIRFLERYTIDRVAHQMLAFYDRALGVG
jgi:glycosyltransferase involved in cell wall biosynthesis